ncbi:MAG TPA: Bax inhibitor-1 family protein [Solirubrobacteraceae bacterium]|jgi:modulator of FtsH protease|nr:Bax inhibitor-1 family protein [Solirubrobacteraceae bacterium]
MPSTTRSPDYTTASRAFGSVATIGQAAVFGQVMGLVAVTVGFTALGAYIGRNLSGGAAIACFIGGFIAIVATSFVARRSERLAITTLFAAGLLLGLGLGPGLSQYAQAQPQAVWQAAGATALFIAGLGAVGYSIRRDLSPAFRYLFLALVGLIVFGLVAVFVSIPHANVIYAVLGLVIFGGYTVLDFNLMRRAGVQDIVPLAAGIFLDVLNVFLFFLTLFGNRE